MAQSRHPSGGQRGNLSLLMGGERGSGKYDEAEFLVGGRGTAAGETDKVSMKLHEGYIAEMERLAMKSGRFPYRSLSDAGRHAWVRHVYWLQQLEPDEVEGSVLHQLGQIDEIVAAEEFQLRFTKNIEATSKMIRGVIGMPGGQAHAGRVVRRIKRRIDLMHAGFWKSYYLKMFMDEFGRYINSGLVLLNVNGQDEDDGGDVGGAAGTEEEDG